MRVPTVSFDHVVRLTDAGGMYEHARGTVRRPEHGYCLDDVARGLVVLGRENRPDAVPAGLREQYLAFVLDAEDGGGRFHNRRGIDLRWSDSASLEDCWGRALWGLGTEIARASVDGPGPSDDLLAAFTRGAGHRSPWPRALAFAGLGAAEVLTVLPAHAAARSLLSAAAFAAGSPLDDLEWCWPQARLTYANAVVPDVLLAAGTHLGAPALVEDGLRLLGWLLERQTRDGHLSMTPAQGLGRDDRSPAFDQQPIEVAALADACARAHNVTGDERWADAVALAAAWFLGANDAATPLYDPASRGCCDGLEAQGRNENQGAESTLAMISTFQRADATARHRPELRA